MPPGRSLRHETCRRSERGDVPKREQRGRPPRQTPYSGYRYRVGHRKSQDRRWQKFRRILDQFPPFRGPNIVRTLHLPGMTKAPSHFVFAPAGRRVESADPEPRPLTAGSAARRPPAGTCSTSLRLRRPTCARALRIVVKAYCELIKPLAPMEAPFAPVPTIAIFWFPISALPPCAVDKSA